MSHILHQLPLIVLYNQHFLPNLWYKECNSSVMFTPVFQTGVDSLKVMLCEESVYSLSFGSCMSGFKLTAKFFL